MKQERQLTRKAELPVAKVFSERLTNFREIVKNLLIKNTLSNMTNMRFSEAGVTCSKQLA